MWKTFCFFSMGKRKVSQLQSAEHRLSGNNAGGAKSKEEQEQKDIEVDNTPSEHIVQQEESGEDEINEDRGIEDSDEGGSDTEQESQKDEVANTRQPANKKQKRQFNEQDIQIARETAELFKSNIFKLEIDELIKETKLKDNHVSKIEKVLHRLHDVIRQIPGTVGLELNEAESYFNTKKVVIPFPDPKPVKAKYKFSYLPPEDITLAGSFGLQTAIDKGTTTSIDMALVMPKELFLGKDYLNYRALYKRAFYLSYLADNLIRLAKKEHLPLKVSYGFHNGDYLCPMLRLDSLKTDNEEDLCFSETKFTINLLVGFPKGIFDAKKLLPDRNSIRIQSEDTVLPTPIYNSSILSLTLYVHYLKYLYTSKTTAEAFREACILGNLWLGQRGFGSSFNRGGFGHFEFAILMSALLSGGGLNGNKILLHGFSSYQLFKATVIYLANMDLLDNHLSFSSSFEEKQASKYHLEGFGEPTIFDKHTKLNVLWKMTKSSYIRLRHLANDTTILLNDLVKDRFDQILLMKSDFDLMRNDLVVTLNIPEEFYDSFTALEKIRHISFDHYAVTFIYGILSQALGVRQHLIYIRNMSDEKPFSIGKRKGANSSGSYSIGIRLNEKECEKLVTRGPMSSQEEAGKKFRSFWGSRASLRRFKDGNIQHCVVWNSTNQEPVVISIIKYALDVHLHPECSQSVTYESGSLLQKLPLPLLPSGSNELHSTSLSFTKLKNSFEDLSKTLINLNLPLKVKSLAPASASLRDASILQPVPFAVSNPNFWNDCVLQFEFSTKWPDELIALEKTKTAFLLKISSILDKETEYRTFLAKDNSIPFNDSIALLHICTPDGYGFRIRVLTERDEILYLRAVGNSDKQKALMQKVYLKFNLNYIGAVKHTRTVATLSLHFPYYSQTVRLFKLWLDSHFLLHHFTEELVELISLKPFVDPAPYSVPHSAVNGFLQILSFLAHWNWKADPLILDLVRSGEDSTDQLHQKLSESLDVNAYRLMEDNFHKIRKTDPSGIRTQFFVGSKDDPSGILWSNEVQLPIASRLTALSRLALKVIKEQGLDESVTDLLFTGALHEYDFYITVQSNSLTTSSGVLPSNAFKNLVNAENAFPDDLATKYDLTQEYLRELESKFGHIVIFSARKFSCLNEDGTNVVTGLFIPTYLSRKKFKVNLGINVKPIEDSEGEVVLNEKSLLREITLLGGDLVQKIRVQNIA